MKHNYDYIEISETFGNRNIVITIRYKNTYNTRRECFNITIIITINITVFLTF